MTYREKLLEEHPECVSPGYLGGCADCPGDYGYKPPKECYICTGKECRKCWNREMKEMTKSDLQTGYIVTLANSDEAVVLLNINTGYFCGDVLLNADKALWFSLEKYNDDLTFYNSHDKEFDIVKVEKVSHLYCIQNMDKYSEDRVLLWDRIAPKEMTHAEIEVHLVIHLS